MEELKLLSNLSSVWRSENPIIEADQFVLETDTKLFKLGDGIKNYNDLEYMELYPFFKEYTALLTQTDENAPVATVLKDSIKGLVWARTATGTYTLTKEGAFVDDKTIPIEDNYVDADYNVYKLERTSADVMTLTTYLAVDTETPADGVLNNRYIHIEIYK